MILTLEVIGAQAADLGAAGRKIFNAIGGTIGRLPDNDWVFPDPYVSGRHALIRYLNGKFFIEDTSTNGVFVNAPDNRLPRAEPHQLKNGDRLYIDAYEIQVLIEGDTAAADARNDPLAALAASRTQALPPPSRVPVDPQSRAPLEPPSRAKAEPPSRPQAEPPSRAKAEPPSRPPAEPPSRQLPPSPPPPNRRDEEHTSNLINRTTELETEEDEEEQEDDVADKDDHKTVWFGMSEVKEKLAEQASPPPAPPPRAKVEPLRAKVEPVRPAPPPAPPPPVPPPAPPKASEPVRRAPAAPPPAPPPPEPPPPAKAAPPVVRPPQAPSPAPVGTSDADDGSQLAALLATAGIQGLEPSIENARMLGGVLRTAMAGLMEMLRARDRMKNELRMRGTSFKAANNNPLKFSANVDDAFHNLFVKHNPAYLQPPEAVEDAFRDVRDHQTAALAAMRLAFESTLAEFDPDRMQDDFDRQMKKGSILSVPAKLRYWEMYRDRYGELAKESDETFRTLFGDEFAKAYEHHLERLRAAARTRENK